MADASGDDQVAALLGSLQAIKHADPRLAVTRALEGADRCHALGDSALASFLEIAAGEVLIELGDVHGAAALIDPAWDQMGTPTHRRDVVTVVAQLRARQGRFADAVSLLEDALEQQENEFDAAVVRGDLGVLFAQHGRRVEAARLLEAAARDPHLDEHHRGHFGRQLALLRSIGARAEFDATGSGMDPLKVADAWLNELSVLLLAADRRDLAANRARIDELIDAVSTEGHALGPAQLARVAFARGCVATLDGERATARERFEEAQSLANASGDVELANWLRHQARSLIDPLAARNSPSPTTAMERIGVLLNQSLASLSVDIKRAHASALEAIELVDAERHRYVAIADRLAWSSLAARVYEIGLVTSVALDDHSEVIEILERARAQGAPVDRRDATGVTSQSRSDASEVHTTSEISDRVLALVRESLGDRPTARPLVASVRARERVSNGAVTRVDLDGVVRTIAGMAAWWWSCHAYGERIYWVVRSPTGRTWVGANTLPGGLEEMADLAQAFRSIATDEDLRTHLLLGDEDHRRDVVLQRVATSILPAPLVEAIVEGARWNDPIRLVWSPPHELAQVPLGLLPVAPDVVVLDGAVLVVAPPTSLAVAGSEHSYRPPSRRPMMVVLGGDADLGMLRNFVASMSPNPSAVFGATRHVTAGIARTLATPEAVVLALGEHRQAVGVYYGHVDRDDESSHSASLSLTDGVDRAALEASHLLDVDRRGAPEVFVLAGCSSLSASHSGTGEWWGLAIALLWQGSRHVIGSTWDVLPTATTEAFVAELAIMLQTSDDAARSLRDLQRTFFRTWRRTGAASPYEWAGWAVTSAAGDATKSA